MQITDYVRERVSYHYVKYLQKIQNKLDQYRIDSLPMDFIEKEHKCPISELSN